LADIDEHWDGTRWTAQPLPLPTQIASGGFFGGVSCPAAFDCTAVGSYSTLNQEDRLFAERWNGHRWAFETVPLPAGAAFLLNSVSCPSGRSCTAVGGSYKGSQQQASIVERWNGTSWALQADAAPAHTLLSDASCRRPPRAPPSAQNGPVWARSRDGGRALERDPLVNPSRPPCRPRRNKRAGRVSCLKPLDCTAVGTYNPGDGDGHPYAEQEH
jgi:hypothetical protein